jgi:hypothetical protein
MDIPHRKNSGNPTNSAGKGKPKRIKKNVSGKSRGSSPEKKEYFKATSNYTGFSIPLDICSTNSPRVKSDKRNTESECGIASADPYTSSLPHNLGVTQG